MREIFEQPSTTPVGTYKSENLRCESAASSSASGSVRRITPEDVYDDRERPSYVPSSITSSERNTPQNYRDAQASMRYDKWYQQQGQYIPTADSRQISTTSTSNTAVSGSENWETFDDASEPEVDASDAYYAKLRAANTGKRFKPEGGYTPPRGGPGKKFKGIYGAGGHHQQTVVEADGGRRLVTGSESAWTDEDAF